MPRSHADTEPPTLSEPLRFAAWAPRAAHARAELRALLVGPGVSAVAVLSGGRRIVAADVGSLLDTLHLGDVRQLARQGWYWAEERDGGVASAEYELREGRKKSPWVVLLSGDIVTVRDDQRVVACGRWREGSLELVSGQLPPEHALEAVAMLPRWLAKGAAAFD